MNRTRLVAIFSAALLALPFFALAQDTGTPAPGYCPQLSQNLHRGMRDTDTTPPGQVTELQKFLSDHFDLNPDDYVTGYFGARTQQNVIRFQQEQNIVPAAGFVGPLTRAAIARVCGQTTTPPPPPQCTPEQPQTQTLPCPTGQTGSITQTRYSTCPGPTWSAWTTTSNTCATPPPQSCIFNNQTVTNGSSVTAYQSASVPAGQQCVSETRTCTNGTLSGSYTYATCQIQAANVPPPTLTLTVNGQESITLPPNTTFTLAWSSSNATTCYLSNHLGVFGGPTPPNVSGTTQGASAAGTTYTYTFKCTNAGGTTTKTAMVIGQSTGGGTSGATLTATPTSGAAPLYVTFAGSWTGDPNVSYGLIQMEYGDGTKDILSDACSGSPVHCTTGSHHTYTSPGAYTVKLTNNDTIVIAQTIVTVTGTTGTGPSISITSPQAGASFARTSTLPISWVSQNAPTGSSVVLDIIYEAGTTNVVGTNLATSGSTNVPLTNFPIGSHRIVAHLVMGTLPNTLGVTEIPFTVTSTTASVGACTYKGQSYAEGQSVGGILTNPQQPKYTSVQCDNSKWVTTESISSSYYSYRGIDICDVVTLMDPDRTDLGCGNMTQKSLLALTPRHGRSPLTITAVTVSDRVCHAYTLSWGDGSTESYPAYDPGTTSCVNNLFSTRTHTYASPGSYTVSYSSYAPLSNSANIRVDGPVASAGNQSQFASAITALRSALQALLQLLK